MRGRGGVRPVTPSDDDVAVVIEAFQAAALAQVSWVDALDGLARATRSRGGELIGLGSEAAVPFNIFTGTAPEATAEFVAAGGGDPRVNSRVRIGGRAPELTVLDETAFTTADDARRFPEYGEWIHRHEMHFTCLSPLLRQDELLVGLALVRSASQGNVTADQRRVFEAVAPHVRAAVRTQMAIESQGASLLADVMEAVSAAAFVCDATGRVRTMSPLAERLLADGEWLRLKDGRLSARREADTTALQAAVALASIRGGVLPPPRTLVVRDGSGLQPLPIEVTTIPGDHAFRFGATVLLIARPPREVEARVAELARVLFNLTPAEAAVAGQLAAGLGAQAIADRTGVAVGTVRTHVRRMFEKTGVRSQIELVAALTARL
jgi:DNA-binding CsgD family transcriptional regulator